MSLCVCQDFKPRSVMTHGYESHVMIVCKTCGRLPPVHYKHESVDNNVRDLASDIADAYFETDYSQMLIRCRATQKTAYRAGVARGLSFNQSSKSTDKTCRCDHSDVAHIDMKECLFSYNCDCKRYTVK